MVGEAEVDWGWRGDDLAVDLLADFGGEVEEGERLGHGFVFLFSIELLGISWGIGRREGMLPHEMMLCREG